MKEKKSFKDVALISFFLCLAEADANNFFELEEILIFCLRHFIDFFFVVNFETKFI